MRRFEPPLAFARHDDFVKAFCGRVGVNALHQRIHALHIFVSADKQVRLHRHDEMADILRSFIILEMIAHVAAERCAGNHAAHHVHQHRERRTLRAADRLHRAAIECNVRDRKSVV